MSSKFSVTTGSSTPKANAAILGQEARAANLRKAERIIRENKMYHMHPTRLRIFLGTKRVQYVLKWILIVIITGAFVYLAVR